MQRICIGHYSAKDDVSGVTSWLSNFIIGLDRLNLYEIHVLLIEYPPSNHKSELQSSLSRNNIAFTLIPSHSLTKVNVENVIRFFANQAFSLFIPHCIESLYYAAINLEKQGLPFIYTMHSDDPVYWANAEIINHHSHARTVCVSKYISEQFSSKFADDSYVIPYGHKATIPNLPSIDLSRFHKVIYIGRIVEEQKRISLVYQTMLELCKLNPNVKCAIIGTGPEENWLIDQLSQNNFDDSIKFLGRKNQQELEEIIKGYGIQLLMSDYEGLPVSILECMSQGLIPVVREIKSGINELIKNGENGLFLNDTPNTAAHQINGIILNSEFLLKASKKCKEIALQYSPENNIKQWVEILKINSARNDVKIKFPKKIILPDFDYRLYGRYIKEKSVLIKLKEKLVYFLSKQFLIV